MELNKPCRAYKWKTYLQINVDFFIYSVKLCPYVKIHIFHFIFPHIKSLLIWWIYMGTKNKIYIMKQFTNTYLCCYKPQPTTYTQKHHNTQWGRILFLPCHNNERSFVGFHRVRDISDQVRRNFKTKLRRPHQAQLFFFHVEHSSPWALYFSVVLWVNRFCWPFAFQVILACLPMKNAWPVPRWLAKSMGVSDLFWGVSVCRKERHTISQYGTLIYWNGLITYLTI